MLQTPITNIDTALSDLSYHDSLKYHYVGGVALAALGRWDEAADFFEICIGSPAVVPSAVQLEALKKLRLVQLIAGGRAVGLPRYAHPALARALKGTPYHAFIAAYPRQPEVLHKIVEENRQLFASVSGWRVRACAGRGNVADTQRFRRGIWVWSCKRCAGRRGGC